jgi:hypothetical protein
VVETFRKLAVTLAALAALGYFIAWAESSIEASMDAAATAALPICLGVALVLGWALGAAGEVLWNDNQEKGSAWWEPFVFTAINRLLGGGALLCVVFFIAVLLAEIGV